MTTELTAPAPSSVGVTTPARPTPRKTRRRPVRRALIVTHRWTSLVLGLVLLVITTSGAILVYRPEITRVVHGSAYAASGGPDRVTFQQAYDTVTAAHPDFTPASVIREHGVLKVTDYTTAWTVDPSTGRILGKASSPSWLRFLDNLHECGLTCKGYPGYVPFLAKDIPHTGWLGYEGAKISYGSLALGVLGILTLFLVFSGLWLWWPRWSQVRRSMSVRWKKGRFARDTDLHKVVGMIALPLLLVWGFTGTGFEIGPLRSLYTALTPGSYADAPTFTSAKGTGPDIGIDAAVAAAHRLTGDRVVSVDPPAKGDKTAFYGLYVDSGLDPYAHGDYPGDIGVGVDRRTGRTAYTFGGPTTATSQTLWDAWSYPVHAGIFTNGWWRAIWFVLGMTPLLLGITGISTWLVRRRTNVARRRARKTAAAAVRGGA